MSQSEHKFTLAGIPAVEPVVAPEGEARRGIVRSVATVVGHPRVVRESTVDVEGEFVASGDGGRAHGQGPGPDASGHTSGEIVVADPYYTSPPLPPWIHVTEPTDPAGPSRDLVLLSAPNGLAAQQFRTLRYRVEQEADAQILAVISPRANEGRSVTAANLALALAEGGRVKVLLVDASLREPAQARLFGLSEEEGLTTTLAARQRDPLAPVPLAQIRRGLYVLAAGPRVNSPHAALASEAAAHLLGALRRSFRYIVVDSSPVFGTAETLAWHGMIDRYVLVARRGRTTTDDLGRAAARIGRDKIVGVSFIGASRRSIAS